MRKSLKDWLGFSTAAKSQIPCESVSDTEELPEVISTTSSNVLGELVQRRIDKLTREFWKLDAEAMQQPTATSEWTSFAIDSCRQIHGSHGLLHCTAANGTVDLWIQVQALAYPKVQDRKHQLSLDAVHSSFSSTSFKSLTGRAVIDRLVDLLNTKGCVLYAPPSHILRWSASSFVIRRFVLCT